MTLLGTLRFNDATAMSTLLKKWIWVLSVLIAIIPTHLLCQKKANPPWNWIPWPYRSTEIEIKFRRRLFTSSIKRKIRHFHVVVVQKRAKKCTKKRDARAKLLFYLQNLLFFWRSRSRPRRWILKSLLTTSPIGVTTKPFSRHKYSVPQTFLVLTHLNTNLLRRLKPLRFVITYNPTLPPECRVHYSQTFPRPLLLRTL